MGFSKEQYDAIVVGSGPNGLSCAIALAQSGLSVLILEKAETTGGGTRTQELTLPGFLHDICSAVHPLALASPFFKSLPLHEHGLKWIYSPVQVAHPFDDGSIAILKMSVAETASALGLDTSYTDFFDPFVAQFDSLMEEVLVPVFHVPKHIGLLTKFGLRALLPARFLANRYFSHEKTRSLFMGIAAHATTSLTQFASSAVGLALHIAGHGVGWPLPVGGAQSINLALLSYFKKIGGEVRTGFEVQDLNVLPKSRLIFLDLTPRQIAKIAGQHLPKRIVNSFDRYRYGPAAFKMDWALSGPIPWKNPDCSLSATVHLGGTSDEIIKSEADTFCGKITSRPFVLLSQPTLFDSTRAPSGAHVAWAYCHVPNGSNQDMTDAIENQIERFAPGFKKKILMRNCMFPKDLEIRNPNLIGGDINGGTVSGRQIFWRPRMALNPYSLGDKRLWICSSSTPPGPGVHGMCGYLAAQSALKIFKS